ncbi:FtsX-like permease family protein [Flammeovirga pectinis]|uniref:FtsX-like permease family protein n=1 Tax=Flammeovirga pectinis TaxID=2494373 RepID=A0A3Q9FU62_9BACT|nr:FtsX-like permease family protein [Flammeovirga pectinis]AZQ64677.1 FtsX-like permease family protein [Flammeovirga pectinis]
MIFHSLKLLWARKNKNILMVLEISFSFVILFLLFSSLYNKFINASHVTGTDTNNVMIVYLEKDYLLDNEKETENLKEIYTTIKSNIKSHSNVLKFSEIDYSHPYSSSWNINNLELDSGINQGYTVQYLTPNAVDLLDLHYIEGGKVTKDQLTHNDKRKSVIVNKQLYDKISKYITPDNEIIDGETRYKIYGIVDYYNHQSDFEDQKDVMVIVDKPTNSCSRLAIKTIDDPRKSEAEIVSLIEKANPRLKISIDYLDSMRDNKNKSEILPLFLMAFVALFLVINIALGLYGVLWYNINKRKGEIGIRRAMGASTQDIFKQIFSEVLLLFIIGIFLGSSIAIQFPILGAFNFSNTEYFMGALLSLGFVLLITIACGYYPSKLATKITPLEALHEL